MATIAELTEDLRKSTLNPEPEYQFIDTIELLTKMIDGLAGLPTNPPSMYIDLEGVNLSRNGTVSIMQIYVHPKDMTYLVDIHTLGDRVFNNSGDGGKTLKTILESSDIPKVFFDVRCDSDALYHHFKISLAGVQDLQLMELGTRALSKRYVNGLAKCIKWDAGLSVRESSEWVSVKEKGIKLFDPKHGGSYEAFNKRPLAEDIMKYCIQDVRHMPKLWKRYSSGLTPTWRRKVEIATKDRVVESQSKDFKGQGPHMARGPW